MKRPLKLTFMLWLAAIAAMAQDYSAFQVNFMVSYDTNKQLFTAWVVPQYDTPNFNNSDTEEKGATAQFTLKVPKGFLITKIQDIKGVWEKNPVKIGNEQVLLKAGADARYEYYVLGKAAVETNYGSFKSGEPVALFSFVGAGERTSEVTAIEANDPFIQIADGAMALNVGNSFYSRSGQRPTVLTKPLEQFAMPIKMETVLADAAKSAGLNLNLSEFSKPESALIVYPNPTVNQLNIKYFSIQDGVKVTFDVVDLKGNVQLSQNIQLKLGFNNVLMNVSSLTVGSYLIRTIEGKKVITKKVVKID